MTTKKTSSREGTDSAVAVSSRTAPTRSLPRYVRSEELLRKTLSMLCNFMWTRQTRPGEHVWSIPVDAERDFDCIFSDAIAELVTLRSSHADLLAALKAICDQCGYPASRRDPIVYREQIDAARAAIAKAEGR